MGRNQKGSQKVQRGRKVQKGQESSKGSANFRRPAKFRRGCEIFTTLAKLARLLLEICAFALFLH